MLSVELDELSGMPNPAWVIPDDEVKAFLAAVAKDPAQVRAVDDVEDVLGFRGYVIRGDSASTQMLARASLPPKFRIRDRAESASARAASQALLEQERAMIEVPGLSEAAFNESALQKILAVPDEDTVVEAAAACSLNYTSWNDFTFWNGDRKTRNNCYNYAANYASNSPGGRALPGRQAGAPLANTSNAAMTAALRADGWKKACGGSSLRIYAVSGYSPTGSWDFHFYRKNLNGSGASRWCHKRGLTRAKNTDESGNYIPNPANADRAFYNNVIGTFSVRQERERLSSNDYEPRILPWMRLSIHHSPQLPGQCGRSRCSSSGRIASLVFRQCITHIGGSGRR